MVEALDTQTNSSRIGVSSQPKMFRTKQGLIRDPFATQKALSKAQRNAIKQLLPQTMLKEWIQRHRNGSKNGNGRASGNGHVQPAAGQHPLDARALALREQIVQLTGSDEAYLNTLGLQGAEELGQMDARGKAAFVNELLKITERLRAKAA